MVDTLVEINLPEGSFDIYDAVSNSPIDYGSTGLASINIPADNAVLAVFIPAGKTISYDLNKAMVDSIVIDYNAGQSVDNYPPRIKSLASAEEKITIN